MTERPCCCACAPDSTRADDGTAVCACDVACARLRRRLLRWARVVVPAAEAEDLVQEALIVFWRKYATSLVASQASPADAERLCRRVLHHRIGNYLRRIRLDASRYAPLDAVDLPSAADSPERRYEAIELRRTLARAIAGLSTAQRQILPMVLSAGRPADGPNRGARYARVYRLRKALRASLGQPHEARRAAAAPSSVISARAARRRTRQP